MNANEMIRRFCVFMQDPDEISVKDQALVFINQALEELQNLTVRGADTIDCSSAQLSVTSNVTGVVENDLPAACRKIIRVERLVSGGENIRINPTPFQSHMDDPPINVVEWEGDTNTEVTWYKKGSVIGIVRPSQAFTIIVYYEAQWASMTEGETECPAPVGFHSLAVSKATASALELEGKPVPSFLSKTISQQESMFMTHISRQQVQAPEYAE